MKGWIILSTIVLAVAGLVAYLRIPADEDVDRLYRTAVKERPTIEAALGECGDLVRYFAERKPTERKKGELDDLRKRFESLDNAAEAAHADSAQDKVARKQSLEKIEEEYYVLRRDAEDLRARLREMKRYDEILKPLISELGQLVKQLADAQTASSDPEFQQRVDALLDQARTFRKMAEDALKRLSVKISEGQTLGKTAVNELTDLMNRMHELLDDHPGSPVKRTVPAPEKAGDGK